MQHNGEINQISVDEEGEFLATAADDGKVRTSRNPSAVYTTPAVTYNISLPHYVVCIMAYAYFAKYDSNKY